MDNTKAAHWILGVALLMIGVFVVVTLVLINSQADDVEADVTINNLQPTITGVYINDAQYTMIDGYSGGTVTGLNSGTTKTIYVNGVVDDNNGDDDFSKVQVQFYRSIMNGACAEYSDNDGNYCYFDDTNTGCAFDTTYGDNSEARFSCQFDLQYYVDSTDANSDNYSAQHWIVRVWVVDDDFTSNVDDSLTKEMETLLALNIPSTIDFGTLALGAETTIATNHTMGITQYGNDLADVEVSGTLLTCDGSDANIPLANIEWSLGDMDYDSGATDLTGDAADTDLAVPLQTDDAEAVTEKLHWNIGIPATGVEGICSGTTTVTTIAS